PPRSADRVDRQRRGGALGDDGPQGPCAAEIPARQLARSVPQQRRAQARAPASRRIRERYRGAAEAPHAGDPPDRGPHRQPARDDPRIRAGEGGQRRRGWEGARGRIPADGVSEAAAGACGMTLSGKTIVVTGGFGALGSVVAETAAKRGASVALLDYAHA